MRPLVYCLLAVLMLSLVNTAAACPTCADGMSHDENARSLVTGYFWSIVFMMSMPFTVLTGISLYFYFQVRKARKLQVANPKSLPEPQLPPGLVLPATK